MSETVYLDNAAATRLDERVLEAMTPYFFETYSVATSQFGYSLGIDAKDALDDARARLAARLGAGAEEFVFTSGSTEGSNMAIKGVAAALGEKKGKHLIVSRIEDFPVLHSARALKRQGFRLTELAVDEYGRVDPGIPARRSPRRRHWSPSRRPTRRSARCRTSTPWRASATSRARSCTPTPPTPLPGCRSTCARPRWTW